jgi:hypothetical protein
VVSFTPRPLYPQGKSPWYSLDRRLGGPQSRSGRGGEDKNSQPPPGIEPQNPDRPAHSPALYRMSYHGSKLFLYSSKKTGWIIGGSSPDTAVSRPALDLTQPPIQRLAEALSLGIKRSGRESHLSLPSSAESHNKSSWSGA